MDFPGASQDRSWIVRSSCSSQRALSCWSSPCQLCQLCRGKFRASSERSLHLPGAERADLSGTQASDLTVGGVALDVDELLLHDFGDRHRGLVDVGLADHDVAGEGIAVVVLDLEDPAGRK